MTKFKEGDKVWILSKQRSGTIQHRENNKYYVAYKDLRDRWYGQQEIQRFNFFMAHELLPWSEGLELIYE